MPSGRWADLALAVAAAGVTAVALGADLPGSGGRPLDLFGWLLAPVLGALLLVRRRAPAAVLIASAVALFGYYAFGYPPVGLALPLAAAFFSAAEAGRLRWAVGVGFVALIIGYGYRSAISQDLGYLFGYDLLQTLVVLGGAIAAGDAVRVRRRERLREEQRISLERQRRVELARRQIDEERAGLARDVHDVLAHTIAVISLHSDVAAEALPDDPGAALKALTNVRVASKDAIRELRASLDVLRGGADGDRAPVGSLRDVPALADRARESGLSVTLRMEPAPTLPATVDSTAFRIVQEALTNVVRHAHAHAAEVTVSCLYDRVELQVRDDGTGTGPIVPGHGLTGMRERAGLLGGTVVAETRAPHGFSVSATIPLDGNST